MDQGIFKHYDQIFFVTHSAGGLVTKAMLDALNTPSQSPLLKKVHCVLYISVPSNGAPLAALVSCLSSNPQLKISPNDAKDFLNFIEAEWDQILRERNPSSPFPRAFLAYEELPIKGTPVVPELYTTSQNDGAIGFDFDHETIVKPRDRASDIYVWAASRILESSRLNATTHSAVKPNSKTSTGQVLRKRNAEELDNQRKLTEAYNKIRTEIQPPPSSGMFDHFVISIFNDSQYDIGDHTVSCNIYSLRTAGPEFIHSWFHDKPAEPVHSPLLSGGRGETARCNTIFVLPAPVLCAGIEVGVHITIPEYPKHRKDKWYNFYWDGNRWIQENVESTTDYCQVPP